MPLRQLTPSASAFILLLAGFSGCQTVSVPELSEGNISQMILGRWYREEMALDGEMPVSHEAIEFAPDGSCSYIQTGTAFYPSGQPAPWRQAQPGRWQVVGKVLKRTWRATPELPARSQEGEILSLSAEEMKLREFPFNSFNDYYRTIRVRNLKTNRPNQALQPTASRRTT